MRLFENKLRVATTYRELYEDWFSRYPVGQQSHFRGQFFSDTASKQLSAAWELYLHESHESDKSIAARHRAEALRGVLDRADVGAYWLGVRVVKEGTGSAPATALRKSIERWVRTFDEKHRRVTRREMFMEQGWALEVCLLRFAPRPEGSRAVGMWGVGDAVLVENERPLITSINKKRQACRGLDAPLIVAVLTAKDYSDDHQVENALLGVGSMDDTTERDGGSSRLPGGLWDSAKNDTSVAAVLAGVRWTQFNFHEVAPTLWTNPHALRHPISVAAVLPWQRTWVDDAGKLQRGSVPTPRAFFGLTAEWPGVED